MVRETNAGGEWYTRRGTLAALGSAAVVGTAGCIGDDDDDGDDDGGDVEYPDWDPENPEFPQPARLLMEEGFDVSSIEELDTFEERDSARYGRDPVGPPENEDDIYDPDPLVFAWTHEVSPASYEDALDPLRENIEAETGREVEFQSVDSYAAMVEAFRSERLHVSRIAAGTIPYAVNLADVVPFAMAYGDGTFGNRLWVITQAGNEEITTVDDLVGRDIVHTEPTSGSGNIEPRVFLEEQEGIVPGEDYEVEYSGGHVQSVNGIVMGDYEAGPVAGPIIEIMYNDDDVDPDDLQVVWAGPFARPLGPMCYLSNLPEDVKRGVERAHIDYDYSDTRFYEEQGYDSFVEIDYATHYDPVLMTHEFQEIEYDIDELEE